MQQGHAQTVSDTKARLGGTAKVRLAKRFRLAIKHEERLSSNVGLEKSLSDFKLSFALHKMVSIAAAYRLTNAGALGTQHRMSASVSLAKSFGAIKAGYRLKFQSTERAKNNRKKLRNRVSVGYKINKKFTPYAAAELHYSTTASEMRQRRLSLGTGIKISRKLAADVFWMYQTSLNKKVQENNHVFGVGLSYSFNGPKKKKGKKKKKTQKKEAPETSEA